MSKVVRVKFKHPMELPDEILEQREINLQYHMHRKKCIDGLFDKIYKLPIKERKRILREKLKRRIFPGHFESRN